MTTIRTRLVTSVLAALALGTAGAASAQRAPDCRAPLAAWTQIDLYLGRGMPDGGIVDEAGFRRFVDEVVTPRFPDGLSILDVAGQYRDAAGTVRREPSKLLVLLVPEAPVVSGRVAEIVSGYKRMFRQESVLRVERPVCLAFD